MNPAMQLVAALQDGPVQPEAKAQKPVRFLASSLGKLQQYNMSVEEFVWMLRVQGGVCAICGRAETVTSKTGVLNSLSIDHCHNTGMIRGLLCRKCNHLLGCAEDSIEVLQNAQAYLKASREKYLNATPEQLRKAQEPPK
jgi:phage FluMu protein Com